MRWGIAQRDDGQWVAQAGDRQLALVADRDQAMHQLTMAYATAQDAPELQPGQRAFTIPLGIATDIDSADLRYFRSDGAATRDLPMPLMLLTETPDWGHVGAVIAGRVDHVEQLSSSEAGPGGLGNITGVFLATPDGELAAMLAEQQALNGISADLDQLEVEWEEVGEPDEMGFVDARMIATSWRVAAFTQCPIPAFPQCSIRCDPLPEDTGTAIGADELAAQLAAADRSSEPVRLALTLGETARRQAASRHPVTAAGIDDVPLAPAAWFRDPQLTGPTPLTVTADGRVFGHLCLWGTPHIGVEGTLLPPREAHPDYPHFRLGSVGLDDGSEVAVGHLTVGTGHASIRASARDAAAHYDDTGAAVADVAAGNDQHGVWVAGWVRPGATGEQVYALRASALSGDWRPLGGRRELVAALAVNVGGFPVPRAQAAAANGRPLALVAAGARELFLAKQAVERHELDHALRRLQALEIAVQPLLATVASAALQEYDTAHASA